MEVGEVALGSVGWRDAVELQVTAVPAGHARSKED